jgi:hypothetical protein
MPLAWKVALQPECVFTYARRYRDTDDRSSNKYLRRLLELYPPPYLVIDLSRFLIHLMPDFIAVPAFEK